MNQEQIKSTVRSFIATFGGVIAGVAIGRGWVSETTWNLITSEAFLGGVLSFGGLIWGLFVHKQSNAIAVVNAMPEVAGVVTHATPAGKQLAEAVPSPTVAPAGTTQAKEIAAKPLKGD